MTATNFPDRCFLVLKNIKEMSKPIQLVVLFFVFQITDYLITNFATSRGVGEIMPTARLIIYSPYYPLFKFVPSALIMAVLLYWYSRNVGNDRKASIFALRVLTGYAGLVFVWQIFGYISFSVS